MNHDKTYFSFSDIALDPGIKYLWLASWYPSKTDKFNGDFIQRHAQALSLFEKLIVLHITYEEQSECRYRIETHHDQNLIEFILYIGLKGKIGNLFSKLYFNIMFHFLGWKLILEIIKKAKLIKLLHVHVPIKMGRLALFVKKIIGIPYIVSEHSGRYSTPDKDSYENRNYFYRYSLQKIIEQASTVIHVSYSLANKFQNLFDVKKQCIIRNVVDERFFNYCEQQKNIFHFIHVSTLNHEKNIKGILDAFHLLHKKRNDFILTVIGNKENIDEEINKFNEISYINCKGEVPYQEVANQMKLSDCLVLFSRNENFPCVIIEALCCGLPVIASDVGGCKEAINDQNGILVESEDINSLVNALEYMLDQKQRFHCKELSHDAISLYNRKTIGNEILKLYQELGME